MCRALSASVATHNESSSFLVEISRVFLQEPGLSADSSFATGAIVLSKDLEQLCSSVKGREGISSFPMMNLDQNMYATSVSWSDPTPEERREQEQLTSTQRMQNL